MWEEVEEGWCVSPAAQQLLAKSQSLREGRRLLLAEELRAELALLVDFTGATSLTGAELGAAGSLMDALLSQHFFRLQQAPAANAAEMLEVVAHELFVVNNWE